MKKIFNITLLLLAAVLLFSCRNDDNTDIPEDIHEHEEISKLEVTIADNAGGTPQVITYIGGVANKKIILQNGKTYNVSLDFQTIHDDHSHSANDEIIEEKDEHFITYKFAGVNVNVKRAADDIVRTDGNKLGLKTVWTVTGAPSNATANIKLIHAPSAVNQNSPSADNQQGTTTGGESDVDALIGVQ
ncbi:hypothetical protein [Chryseobacterium lathyri]|jgi:hypothetical protein|uniref:Lipoprotein n=1 Tax=Chryseobacterium lathyri TaxID=395933 RepID=A0ABT9SL07_9FLAO|nr:hypothetical protein [Chryseobacterium lathyri]MDP9960079.1 hypothetical protein [Chryseobacterium lathyri]MDQ0067676.1 hypothetical protein [Chryseobacterium lathyri]